MVRICHLSLKDQKYLKKVTTTLTSTETNQRKDDWNRNVGARYGNDLNFVRKVMMSTCFIKSGVGTCAGVSEQISKFSGQNAKVVKFSDYSFPTFVIRKMDQRDSYSKGYGGVKSSLKIPTKVPL